MCPHRGAETHAWAHVHWEPEQEVQGSLTPKPPVISSLGCCSQQQSEQHPISTACQRERTARDLTCSSNTSAGSQRLPRPRKVLDLLDLAHEHLDEQTGVARWRLVIGFGAFWSSVPTTESHERSRHQLPGWCLAPRGHWGHAGGRGGDAAPRKEGSGPAAWGASCGHAAGGDESAAPNLLDFPEQIKPGAGRVRLPPSPARHLTRDSRTQRRKRERVSLNG